MAARAHFAMLDRYGDRAGFIAARANPLTGDAVVLYDAEPAGLDPDGGRWVTVCEAHGTVCNHRNQRTARAFLRSPEFCEDCLALGAGEGGA